MQLVVDGGRFKTKEEFYKYISTKLSFPDYYSCNLDSFSDILEGYVELPDKIIWLNYSTSKIYLGDFTDKVIEILKDAAELHSIDLKIELK